MPSVTLKNTTSDSFRFTGSEKYLDNPPQEINPGDTAVINYTKGEPSVMWYIDEGNQGQIVVEVGNDWQGNKLWGEGAFRLEETGLVEEFQIVRK